MIKTVEAMQLLKDTEGYEDWMKHWVAVDLFDVSQIDIVPIYICFHPDNRPFYISSSTKDVIKAFNECTFGE